MIVDCAVYDDGVRRPGTPPLDQVFEAAREHDRSFAWIGLSSPTEGEFDQMRVEFGLHQLAIEDAVKAHQRPKIEVYGDTLFVVIKPARYVDRNEIIKVSQIMLFIGRGFVVTVRHGGVALTDVREELEREPERLRCGPGAVLHAVLDHVVDGYEAALADLDSDIDEVEDEVFRPGRGNHAERIYRMKREVLELRRAVVPLTTPVERLTSREVPWIVPELRPYFRDVHDHLMRSADHVDQLDGLLTSVLGAQLTQVTVAQNEDMRKISAWVAIAAVPTMLAGIYGMNFHHMPELSWSFGYYWILGVMAVACTGLYALFRRSGWL
ncbi:MAG: magnesium/cobalt transporter CorA [Frankiaceae bacterium]